MALAVLGPATMPLYSSSNVLYRAVKCIAGPGQLLTSMIGRGRASMLVLAALFFQGEWGIVKRSCNLTYNQKVLLNTYAHRWLCPYRPPHRTEQPDAGPPCSRAWTGSQRAASRSTAACAGKLSRHPGGPAVRAAGRRGGAGLRQRGHRHGARTPHPPQCVTYHHMVGGCLTGSELCCERSCPS